MNTKVYFRSELFAFLRELRKNNNKEWFQTNKSRYEQDVREPFLDFISDFGSRLGKISRHYVADPRKVGGSLFRIYRDTRFSKDKRPYKTNVGAHFRHIRGKDVHAPGFYLHLEPDEVFVGAGIWHPENKTLIKIRDAIVEHPDRWKEAKTNKKFTDYYYLAGDSLKRPPRGYDPEHPFIEDLKRKDFTAIHKLSEADALATGFLDKFANICTAANSFMEFLTTALDLSW